MKTALVGLGRMGFRHLQVLRELMLDVVGVCDVLDAARTQARESGIPQDRIFSDFYFMIKEVQPELVVVASTAPSHENIVCHATSQGARAILCEKPMSVSLASCDRMIAACKTAGTHLAINHQMRFMEQYTWAKAVTSASAFGGLSSVSVVAGNFGMAMNGSHYFEMFRYMTDEVPVRVAAWFSSDSVANPRGVQFEDRAGTVRLETPSGKRFYMDASTDHGHGMHVTYAGPKGRLDIDELAGCARLTQRKPEYSTLPTTRYGMPWDTLERKFTPTDAVTPTRAVMRALIEGDNYPDGSVGLLACELLVAAYLSHEVGGETLDLRNTKLPRERIFPWA